MLLLAGTVALFSLPGALQAQRFEIGPAASYVKIGQPLLGSIDDEDPQDDDSRILGRNGYGVRVTWNTRGYFGHEFGYTRTKAEFETKIRTGDPVVEQTLRDRINIHQASYNFMMYFMPAGERFRPFMTAGLQAFQYDKPNIEGFDRPRSRNYGGNYGAGLKILLVKNALVRFDFRHYVGGSPYGLQFGTVGETGGWLGTLEGSAGFSIAF
jgi:hypothetical protein